MGSGAGGHAGTHPIGRRRFLSATAGLAAVGTGCMADGTPTPTPTRRPGDFTELPIEVLHGWTGPDGSLAIRSVERMFEARHPDVTLDLRPIGGTGNENLNSAIDRRLAGGNPPTSFASWPGPTLDQYEGRLLAVDDVWTRNGFDETIHERAAANCRRGGDSLAVPIGSHRVNNLYYNTTLVERAGVDPEALTGVQGFLDALDRIDRQTDVIPLAHGMQAPWTNLQFVVEVLLGQAGNASYERLVAGEGSRDVVRRALETSKGVFEQYVNDDAATISFTAANEKLIQGRAAFMTQGSWVYGMYRSAESFEFRTNWDAVPFPGTDETFVLNLDSFVFPRNNPTPNKKDLWAAFVGKPDPQIAFSNRKGSVPVRTDFEKDRLAAYPRRVYTELLEAPSFAPTLAHGLAAPPRTLSRCKAVIAEHFMGPFDVEATTDGLLAALSA